MVIESACGRLGWNLAEQRCVVQGFGNVGGIAATELHDRGAPVIAVSDISGGVYAEQRPAIPDLHAYVALHGSLEGYDGRLHSGSRTRSCSSCRATSSCSPRARIR